MTQEEKELLIRDLCGRLHYGVKASSKASHLEINTIDGYFVDEDGRKMFHLSEPDLWQTVDYFQYYLRPMLSMTEEEENEYDRAANLDVADSAETLRENLKAKTRVRISKWYHGTDWLNAHHFDYRGLIEKGLALEAPEGMYKM